MILKVPKEGSTFGIVRVTSLDEWEKALAEETGARDRGIVEREDMTGFNWSEVPVILVEMGFLSNPEEDQAMSTDSYRKKLADGITRGIESWLAQ